MVYPMGILPHCDYYYYYFVVVVSVTTSDSTFKTGTPVTVSVVR